MLGFRKAALMSSALIGLGALSCMPTAHPEAAAEWPQFRGAARDGVAAATLLRTWPEGGPRVDWKVPLGPGFSQIAVAGGRVFDGFSDAEQEYLGAFEPTTGAEIWRATLGATFVQEEFGSGPRRRLGDSNALFGVPASEKWHYVTRSSGPRVPHRPASTSGHLRSTGIPGCGATPGQTDGRGTSSGCRESGGNAIAGTGRAWFGQTERVNGFETLPIRI